MTVTVAVRDTLKRYDCDRDTLKRYDCDRDTLKHYAHIKHIQVLAQWTNETLRFGTTSSRRSKVGIASGHGKSQTCMYVCMCVCMYVCALSDKPCCD